MLNLLILILLIVFVIILLIPFLLGSIGMGILRHFSREMNDAKEEKKKKQGRTRSASSRKSSSSAQQGHQKVFADDEGTYVDFEEV